MRTVDWPEIGLIAITRAMAGFGAGLLVSSRMTNEKRKAIGWTLVLVGALTTFPLIAHVRNLRRQTQPPAPVRRARSRAMTTA